MDQEFRPQYMPKYTVRTSEPEPTPSGGSAVTAWFEELPSCRAQAATSILAVRQLWQGLPAFLDMLTEHGQPIPEAKEPRPMTSSSGTPGVSVSFAPPMIAADRGFVTR
jgi:predicted RNase H-like HicB family nuclease